MESRALGEPSAADSLYKKAKYSVFGVFHSMTDKTASKHPTARSQWVQLGVILFDFVQALTIVLHSKFHWPGSVLSWMNHFHLLDALLPDDPLLSSLVRAHGATCFAAPCSVHPRSSRECAGCRHS